MKAHGVTRRIDRIVLTVPDLDAAQAFYREALGFRCLRAAAWLDEASRACLGAGAARVMSMLMGLGAQRIELLAFDPPGRPYPSDSTSSDAWFQHCAIVVADMPAAYGHVRRFAVTPISEHGPETLPPETGSVTAYKFRDPFGHPLELLHFPHGVGDPAWHGDDAFSPFLGIDHTAITVSDAQASTAFYESMLGFEVAARSRNRGPEQSRLDAVPADEVDVVSLTPQQKTPHLELLGYRAGLRRPRPAAWGGADCVVTRTVLIVDDDAAEDPNPVAVSDPDGHVVVLQKPL